MPWNTIVFALVVLILFAILISDLSEFLGKTVRWDRGSLSDTPLTEDAGALLATGG